MKCSVILLLVLGLFADNLCAEKPKSVSIRLKTENYLCEKYTEDKTPQFSSEITEKKLYKYMKVYKRRLSSSLYQNYKNIQDLDQFKTRFCTFKLNQCLSGRVLAVDVVKCQNQALGKLLQASFKKIEKLPLAPHKIVWNPNIEILVNGNRLTVNIQNDFLQNVFVRYRNEIQNAIVSNWKRPPDIEVSGKCEVNIKQTWTGEVVKYVINKCSSENLRDSVNLAMKKTRFLPKAPSPDMFESDIVISLKVGLKQ